MQFRYVLIAGLMATAGLANGHTLSVPFFADNAGGLPVSSGAAGFIGMKNMTSDPIVLDIVYSNLDVNGFPVLQAPQKYMLQGDTGVSWRPYRDDPAEGVAGRAVPNVLPGGTAFGSATISWRGGALGNKSLTGRYVQLSSTNSFAHVIKN